MLARGAMSNTPRNLGEGIGAIGKALAYNFAASRLDSTEAAARANYGKIVDTLMGGSSPSTPATPTVPDTPSVPHEAMSGTPMADTAAPLSGGIPQANTGLTDAVAKLESGGSPVNGPAQGYANYRYQQFPAFVKQYGDGGDGVLNYAKSVLAANPSATFGDMYGGYVTGTGDPSSASVSSLQTTTQPGAKGAYENLVRNSPIDPKTPLSQLLGVPSGNVLGPQIASNDPNFVPSTGGMNPQLAAMLSPNMMVGQSAFAPAQPPNPDTSPSGQTAVAQALMGRQGGFTPSPAGQPNITTLPVRPTQFPIGNPAPQQQMPQAQPLGQSGMPPNIAQVIKQLAANPLPEAQAMANQLMTRYMQPPQYDLMQGADGTITAINKLNPRDNYVAGHIAPKPIAVAPGGTLVTPGATGSGEGGGVKPVYQNTTGLFDKPTLTSMADQYLTGDKSVLQNLGRTAIGGMNISALRERIVSRAKEMGITPTEIASRIGQFDSYVSAQKATGTRGGNVTMAATEAGNLGNLVSETSAAVPRTNYPVWNKVTNAYAENTGDPNIVKFTGALNSYINAYARAINPSGSTTVSDKEHAREILDTAMSHGQIEAGISQLQKELEQAKRAPSAASEIIKGEFMNRSNPQNSAILSQARDAINQGADRNAVIQRLRQKGIDPSGL